MNKSQDSRTDRVLGSVVRVITSHPGMVLVIAFIVCILALWAARNIETRTRLQDMLPENNPQVMSYTQIDELFSGGSSAIIVLEGTDRKLMVAAADALVSAVKTNETLMTLSRTVHYGIDEDFVSQWGFVLQEPDDLERTSKLFRNTDLLSYLTALNNTAEDAWTGEEPEEDLETFRQESDAVAWLNQIDLGLSLIERNIAGTAGTISPEAGEELARIFAFGDLAGFNDTGELLTVSILPNFDIVDMDKVEAFMDEVKLILSDVGARFPGVTLSYTGEVPIQADEQEAMNFDMMVPAMVAMVLILILFLASFPRFSTVVFIVISLIAGIILTYGFLGVTVKVVNMLTSVMAVLLVGLGVDYGIQLASNYHRYRRKGETIESSMKLTFSRAGAGIVLAALTTSVAFFVMAATGSMAFRQFGLVLGSGIIFCMITMMSILPSALVLTDRGREKREERRREHRMRKGSAESKTAGGPERAVAEYRFLAVMAASICSGRNRWLIGSALVSIILLMSAVLFLRMDYDLMAMEPQNMPSIITYKKVMDAYGITPFQSMIVAEDVEDARRFTVELEKQNLVADLASVSYLIPDVKSQLDALEIIRLFPNDDPSYRPTRWDEEHIAALAREIQRLEWNVIEMADLSVAGLGDGNRIQARRDEMIHEILGAETGRPGREVFQTLISLLDDGDQQLAGKLERLDGSFGPALSTLIDRMAEADRTITVSDLPDDIRKRFFAEKGLKNLVYIYPRDGMMESSESMRAFNSDLATVDSRITGSAQIAVAWLEDSIRATLLSALFIFIAVVAFLALMMRRIRDVLRAVVPLVIGMIWMLGLYAGSGLKLNFLNLAVIPLVIGMGIDFGIHLTHRYRIEKDIQETYRSTGRAVFLSGATTLIGFGSLALIGKFPSIASMGSILAFGIGACLLAAFIILPALLGMGRTLECKKEGIR